MKITNVSLENFTQHRLINQSIDENVVGIVGRNGSGKSNFASAISMAITGEFGKKKKKDLITFGEKSGSINIEGVIKGKPFNVLRKLNNNDCTLSYNNETVDGADSVNDRFLELLGCDKSFLPNMVFVSQTDILGILFGRPAERNKMLQRFFGLEKAAKLELVLGQWKSNISYPAIIDEAQSIEAIKGLEMIIDGNNVMIQKLEELIAKLETEISSIDVERITKNKSRAERKEKYEANIKELDSEIARHKVTLGKIKAPDFTEEDIESLVVESEALDATIASTKKLITLLESAKASGHNDADHCPLCKSKLTEKAQSDMLELLDSSQSLLVIHVDKTCGLKSKIRQNRQELSKHHQVANSTNGALTEAESKKRQYQDALDSTEWPNHPSSVYVEGIQSIDRSQAEVKALLDQMTVLRYNNAKLDKQIEQHNKDLEAAQKVRGLFSNTKVHESRISRVRDVFRHDGISGKYVNYQMNSMSTSINQYLSSFGAEYRVSVGEDNEFICDFGSKIRPAMDLSCGQKVVLSLAFRFAACEMFSTGVDLIVLDEPTTWLDKETIANFKNIIESVSELSDSHNLQILIVTHERSLMPYFRQTIEF
jgi:DNA repair exonuclease SbcCD ATPase subunit